MIVCGLGGYTDSRYGMSLSATALMHTRAIKSSIRQYTSLNSE